MIQATENGSVELYHNNSKKFETTSSGITVNGAALVGGNIEINTDAYLKIGASNDLSLTHTGTDSYIQNVTGNLYITNDGGGSINLQTNGSENAVKCIENGAVELYHNNSKKFETLSDGVNVTGTLKVNGSALSGGKILQVKNTIKKDTFSQSLNRNTYSNDMGLSVSITPSSSSNKILIVYQVFIGLGTDENVGAGIFKDGSELTDYRGDAAGNRGLCGSNNPVQGASYGSMVMGQFLDSPSTTSSTTYDIRIKYFRGADDQTILLNRNNRDNNASFDMRCCSTITCFEVSA